MREPFNRLALTGTQPECPCQVHNRQLGNDWFVIGIKLYQVPRPKHMALFVGKNRSAKACGGVCIA